jgi:hypothetical protein
MATWYTNAKDSDIVSAFGRASGIDPGDEYKPEPFM